MTRHLFGAQSSDWTVTLASDGTMKAISATMTVWDSREGGNQIVDLQDTAGQPIVAVTSRGGQYAFWGPDDDTLSVWLDGGGGDREQVVAQQALHDSLIETAAGIASIRYDLDGTPFLTDLAGTPGSPVQYDADGTPYLVEDAVQKRLVLESNLAALITALGISGGVGAAPDPADPQVLVVTPSSGVAVDPSDPTVLVFA